MKAYNYCTKLQMHEHRVSFKGIDTYRVKQFGDFCYTSNLLKELGSISIIYISDVNFFDETYQRKLSVS